MKKNLKSIIAIFTIIAIVYTLLVTIIPFNKPASSWIAYGFTIVAIIACFVTCILSFKGNILISKIYGLPIFKIGIGYSLVQIAVSLVFYIIGTLVTIPFWISLLACIVLLAAALIGVIATSSIRETIIEMEQATEKQTSLLSSFQLSLHDIADLCKDEIVRQALNNLIEETKYSDPVSSPVTEEIEIQILNEVEFLREKMLSAPIDDILEKISTIERLLKSRNRICKQNKAY